MGSTKSIVSAPALSQARDGVRRLIVRAHHGDVSRQPLRCRGQPRRSAVAVGVEQRSTSRENPKRSRSIRGQFSWGIGAPDEAQAHFERPLALPYVGKVAYRQQFADGVGRCHATRAEIEVARHYVPAAKATWITHSLKPVLDLWDGDLEAADALATRTLETSRRTGNRWDEWASCHLSARVRALAASGRERSSSCDRDRPVWKAEQLTGMTRLSRTRGVLARHGAAQ